MALCCGDMLMVTIEYLADKIINDYRVKGKIDCYFIKRIGGKVNE